MKNISGVQIAIAVAIAAISALVTWSVTRHDLRRQQIEDTLQPVAALLADNQKIIESLKKDGYVDSEAAILSTYLNRIRKDGVPKNSDMKQRIDALVNNDTMIVALLSRYAPHARSAAFRVAATEFTSYGSSFRDRWQSVFEIFMAGGNLPAAGPPFPDDFNTALASELALN